jgi:hypothetical protein
MPSTNHQERNTAMELTPVVAAETLIVENQRKAEAKKGVKAILEGETLPPQAAGYANSLSPDEHLRPMFVWNDTSKTLLGKSVLNPLTMTKWAGQSAVPAASVAGFMMLTNPLTLTSPMLTLVATAGVSALTLTGSFKAIKLKNRKTSITHRHLQHLAEQSFLQWLKNRYGIVISSKTSQNLASLYTFGKSHETNYKFFEDSVTGRKYLLRCDHKTDKLTNVTYYLRVTLSDDRFNEALTLKERKRLEEESLLESVQQKANQVTKLIPVSENLGGHNEEVVSSSRVQKILTSLALLSEHSLNVETQHIVGRIRETLNDGLATYEHIIAFGPNPKAEQKIVTLLHTLETETAALVQDQVNSLVKSLDHKTIFSKDVAKATISGTGALDMTQNAS